MGCRLYRRVERYLPQEHLLPQKQITANAIGTIKQEYNRAKKRLILLDYDGTLAALKPRPEDAEPTPELIETLQKLCEDSDNHIVINSGRDHFTLENGWGTFRSR